MFFFYSIFVLFLATVYADEGQKSYEGWVLIKAYAATESQLKTLNSLREDEARGELQIWAQGNLKRPFDIFISPEYKEQLLTKLQNEHIRVEMRSENVQRALDAEKVTAPLRTRASFRNSNWFTKFLRLDEINAAIDTLVRENSNIASVKVIGSGHEGNEIRLVTVTSDKNSNKPGIWVDGGIHAREWASPATVLFMLNKLITNYNTNTTEFVDRATWYFVVVLNPDGYKFTHEGDRMWRKNRRSKGHYRGCEGVDLNRNFDASFGGLGTSGDKCDDIYRGESAFSEPESKAVRDFVTSHKDIKAFLTIHAYSQMWFYPYGDARKKYSPDVEELKRVANAGANALYSRYRTRYEVGTAADLLYEAAGGSDDWAKGKANIKYVYCLELRPSGNSAGNGFILPPSKIIETGEETWDGIQVVANAVLGKQY
jgi:murein tripeptide amidase MpaA